MRRRRPIWVVLLCLSLLISTVGWSAPAVLASPTASPPAAGPDPRSPSDTLQSVTDQLRALADQNEALTERFNGARIQVRQSQQRLAATMRAVTRAQDNLQRSRAALAGLLAQQYREPRFSQLGALLSSTSGNDYLARMDSFRFITRDRAQVVTDYASARSGADAAATRATTELADATARRAALAAQQTVLQTRITDYQRRLATLTAAQRTAVFTPAPAPSRATPISFGGTAGGSSAAQTAVKAAMAQLGKPYVFATAGPSTFDCSGLTMFAWAAAGVSIPHQSGAQFSLGTPVPADKLAPGDLVFFYSDLHHVGLYIGNGMMVHAPTEGDVVKVTPISAFGSDYMGARRLG
jgi:cell wall-associated NlpC family hydrolase